MRSDEVHRAKNINGGLRLLLDDLHWLTIPQRMRYKLALTCVFDTELQRTSPTDACQSPKFPAANIYLWPAVAKWIPRCRRSTFCTRFPQSSVRRLLTHAWFVAWSVRRLWTF